MKWNGTNVSEKNNILNDLKYKVKAADAQPPPAAPAPGYNDGKFLGEGNAAFKDFDANAGKGSSINDVDGVRGEGGISFVMLSIKALVKQSF